MSINTHILRCTISKASRASHEPENQFEEANATSNPTVTCFRIRDRYLPVRIERRLIVSTFVFYIFCTNFSVLLNYAICNSSKVVSAREWMQAVMGSDEILSIISNIYDDLRHKFTSNVKCEFVVCALCLTICDVYVHSLN